VIPNDLTPAELLALNRLLNDTAEQDSAEFVPLGEAEPESAEEQSAGSGSGQPSPPLLPSPAVVEQLAQVAALNLGTGNGIWRGHAFILSAEELKAVHKVCADAIAANLTAEIARVRDNLN